MDHRISKDMISSGMIPSGEKKQEDLSRTQYGTAPSPNALSDVYKSMYEKKEETLNEHHKKDADGNTIPHEHEEELNEGKIPAGLQAYLDKKKGKKEDKKEMKEGMGLYANIHAKRKRGGKMRKKGAKGAPSSQDFANAAKTAKEEVDKFDVVYNHFISEGYSEKEAYAKMSNLTEEQLDEFMKALATRAAQYGANLGKPASQKINVVNPPRKPFDAKRKPFDAKKPEPKPGDSGFKAKSASDVVSAAAAMRKKRMEKEMEPKKGEVMADEYQYVNEIAQFIPMLTKGAAALSKAIKPVVAATKKTVSKVVNNPTVQNLATQGVVSSAINSGGEGQEQRTGKRTAQYASADLFDIVKGQLLDEGLSEEEIKDIMLTLTPDEIMSEIKEGQLTAGADKDRIMGTDDVARQPEQVANMFNKNIPRKKDTGGKVDRVTRRAINTSARDLGIQGPTTLKQSVEPKGETI